MGYKNCAAQIAANIAQDCNRPLVGGYTGRAVIIPANDFAKAEVVVDANNPRKIMSIILPPDGSVLPYSIDNVFQTPFTGSTTAGNSDNGRNGYLKTLALRVPMRGADVSKDIVEPLVKDPAGFVVIVEKRDKVGDGSYEVIGYQNSLRGDIASVTRDESANGGDWLVNLTSVESWAEVTLVGAGQNYETAKKNFDELLNFEPMVMRMTTSVENQEFYKFSANGVVYIDSIKNGEEVRKTLVSPNSEFVTIENDEDTEIVVFGEVTYLNASNEGVTGLTSLYISNNTALTRLVCSGCTGLTSLDASTSTALTSLDCVDCTELTSLDVSKNTILTELYCNNCTSLTSLNVSKNTKLAYLYCFGCTGLTSLDLSKNKELIAMNCSDCTDLMLLDIQNTALLENGTLANQSMANLTTLQVAGTSAWAYEQVESWLNDFAPNNGKLYADENTPQGVITAAEGKSWEVIYQA